MQNKFIFIIIYGFIASTPLFAVQPRPVDLTTRQNWVAAKLEEQIAAPEEKTFGITVLDNHNSVQRNSSHEGAMIRLGEKTFARGIYTHANSHLVVRLPGPGARFSATFGVDNNHSTSGFRGSARFHVLIGDKEIFTSGIMRGGDAGIPISLDLDG
ncbi:MAG: NPCBM/NEW2 domain-containing protein, partial [Planctomycetaceae bacterium]|nr:NPCBM/NEW2 domain-containing protein [Planctomycetaceae bacterium]